ncbi:MAG: glycine betaine/L-proline ABC transporter ATP-binding protein [Trueperaceae bacterium]
MTDTKIEVKNLYKIFGKRPDDVLQRVRKGVSKQEILKRTGHTVGLDDVSLDVRAGETFVVMGLSGSGKSTLVRCLNRLIEPTSGEIVVDGVDIVQLGRKEMQALRREKMGMVFQHFALLPHRNVIDNVAYGLKLQGMGREERYERARTWIEVVGLKGYEKARPTALSGGMQQRVGLARALATDPEILLMDEAFSALDPLIRREMQDELIRLQRELHKTIVFITHDLDEALRLGDRVAILNAGRVVQVGTPEQILTEPADDYVEAFVQNVDRSRVLSARLAMETGLRARVDATPTSLLTDLANDEWKTAFVTDGNGRYKGVVGIEEVRKGARRGDADLRKLLSESAPTVRYDSPLSEMFSVGAASSVPIAVLGDNDVLEGILTHRAVLAALSSESDRVAHMESAEANRHTAETTSPKR